MYNLSLFNLKDLVVISTISILIYFSIDWYLIGSGFAEFPSSAYLGLFHYLRLQFDLKELLLFLFIPLLSLIPIILIIYGEKLIKFEFNLFLKLFLPIIISILIILQPILGGPTPETRHHLPEWSRTHLTPRDSTRHLRHRARRRDRPEDDYELAERLTPRVHALWRPVTSCGALWRSVAICDEL